MALSQQNESMSNMCVHSLSTIIAAYLLLGGLYSVMVPIFEAPDERQHYGYIRYLASEHHLPLRGEDSLAEHEASQPPLHYTVAALGTAWGDHSAFPPLQPNRYYNNYQAPGTVNDNKNVFLHSGFEEFPWRGVWLLIGGIRRGYH